MTIAFLFRLLGFVEERLRSLLGLLVTRMGKRSGAWCVLPLLLTHELIFALIAVTRVSTTKLFTRLCADGQMVVPESGPSLCFEPMFIADAHLAA